ncbi:serine hydrolase domain-containing protein [Sphingorhabdus sp. Alg231-15]|uniref:serine hydrolase domain-containing protein n=1 Tax=Sphingorhabdus sp. Alg231-15 TaxID=1922222 RepID=UPI00307BD971
MNRKLSATVFAAGLLVACCTQSGRAQVDAPAIEPPLGLWVWSTDGAASLVSMSIEIAGNGWRVMVDGAKAEAMREGGVISVRRPDGQKFVGKLTADKSEIRGHWFQPPSLLDYQYVATPVVLSAVTSGKWQAEFAVQSRPYRVFLDIFQDEGSEIAAVVRNPEGNNILGSTQFRLLSDENDGWVLMAGRGKREKRHRLGEGVGRQLLLDYDRFDEPIALKPATDKMAAGYYSRQNRDLSQRSASPPRLDDGWKVSAPEGVGFDPSALQALTAELASADTRDRRPRMIHSLLVARKGKLVFEEYFFGHDRETRHDVRSLGKVFGSVMIGALQQQGYSIDASLRPIPDLLKRAGRPVDDPRKADVSLEHLMTYTSGLDCDVNSDSAGSEMRMWEQQEEKDYWLYTAGLRMLHDPGERYAYCSGSANLVGASLESVGGASVYELFDRLIAKPLKFGPYHWALAPNGEGYLGGGAYMRPRDILKVGAMFAAGGVWNGEQIVEKDWVRESTTAKVEISAKTTGMTPETFQNSYFGGSQAYIWSVGKIAVGERSYMSYQASGNGGQLLFIVPELDLVVGFTGGNYRMGGIWGRWRNEIVGGHIIPAIIDLP